MPPEQKKKATTALEERQVIDRLWDTYGSPLTAAAQGGRAGTVPAGNRRIGGEAEKIAALGHPPTWGH